MYENLGDELTVDDLARRAMFSKFHFSRVFQRATGLSPGRFLSAVRLQEAKRLLVTTSLTVTEISHRVGFSSVGTFSSRFTGSVGTAPTVYRQSMGAPQPKFLGNGHHHNGRINGQINGRHNGQANGRVNGHVNGHGPAEGGTRVVRGAILSPLPDRPIFAGMFPHRIMEGRPVAYTVLPQPGPFLLLDVPEGEWHLIAQSVAAGREDTLNHPPGGDRALCVGRHGPITVRHDAPVARVDLQLRPMRPMDPPALLAMRDLLSNPGLYD
ncbi:helix-turn-helix transcriptional regulator [Nonomuraea sp. B12E4]|uniref:helix-turn-helix transcriptional regulator n=1 Tax=Nonomuraea sp. B12E4 TaxID=3153564 RepID=UPI00325EEFBC